MRPKILRAGDLVALVAPSGWVRPERVAAQVKVLESWGLRARVGGHATHLRSYLSAADEERLADFNAALRDEEVRGIWCLRGGYGAQRIVDGLDFDAVRADPKLVIGFSDITAIHLALWTQAGLATVHGPVASHAEPGGGGSIASGARRALLSSESVVVRARPGVRVAGRAEGLLLGGI